MHNGCQKLGIFLSQPQNSKSYIQNKNTPSTPVHFIGPQKWQRVGGCANGSLDTIALYEGETTGNNSSVVQ